MQGKLEERDGKRGEERRMRTSGSWAEGGRGRESLLCSFFFSFPEGERRQDGADCGVMAPLWPLPGRSFGWEGHIYIYIAKLLLSPPS